MIPFLLSVIPQNGHNTWLFKHPPYNSLFFNLLQPWSEAGRSLQLKMMLRFFPSIALVLASSLAVATGSNRHNTKSQLDPRDEECENNFSLCSPTGASSVNTPAVGSELSSLYLDLVDSIHGIRKHKRTVDLDNQILDHKLQPRGSKIGLCCRVASSYHIYSNTGLSFNILGLC